MLGLWSLTGDGASFNAASASTAADVRWKKLTGIFGQPFPASSRLTCSLWRWEMALGPRGLLAPDLSRVAWTGGGSSEGWLRGSELLLVSYRPLALSLSCKKELAERRATSKGPKRCSLVVQDRLRPWCRPVLTRWEHSYTRRSHNHARAAASCVGVRCMRRLTLAAAALARARGDSCAMAADRLRGALWGLFAGDALSLIHI